jgi:hypothetical protein
MLQLPTIEAVQDRVHSLAENHLPDTSEWQWPKVDLGAVDMGRTFASAAAAVHPRPRPGRSRRPIALAALAGAGIAGWLLLSQKTIQDQLARWARLIRSRIAAALADDRETGRDQPVAFPAAETVPVMIDAYMDQTVEAGTPYPVGLGSNNGEG